MAGLNPFHCSPDRPWGIHPTIYNDSACSRCGWTAPGPIGDARLDAIEAAEEARLRAEALGWEVIEGGGDVPGRDDALAA